MEQLKIGICGVSGRMGRTLVRYVLGRDDVVLSGATEKPDHPWIGQTVKDCIKDSDCPIPVVDDPGQAFRRVDAIIDFTSPAATVSISEVASTLGIVHVVGTTGLTDEHLDVLAGAAGHAVIVRAGNMSLGVNLLVELTEKIGAALDADFDVEILESHHRHKVDSPSGTALMLGRAAERGRGAANPKSPPHFHVGNTGPRKRGAIGYSAVRGGDVVGEHDVIFAADGERVILRHIATDRAIYARGAIAAAIWGQNKPFGEYDMADVLGLKVTSQP